MLTIICVAPGAAQTPQSDANQPVDGSPTVMQAEPQGSQRRGEGRGRPVFGKLSGIQKDAIDVTLTDGTKASIKLASSTEFRKDRQPAKLTDFKVGDMVMVRTNQDAENASGATAVLVAGVPQGFTGRGGGAGQAMMQGTLGKDYVIGEIKSVDAPKLTVLRTDNVTQTLELNEETSLRRGRESITMADIQPGDHIFARGAVANDVFVPKGLNVIPPEQWQRMQEMNEGGYRRGAPPQSAAPPNGAAPNPPAQPNPPEQRH